MDQIESGLKDYRRTLFRNTDWTQLPDIPLTNEEKDAWATYRQALRDIPSHSNWPLLEIEDWPTPPT
tara:strand:+ start:3000 stop:3200 length:201 start_codon:yes stop_codon:yes gene_type:complete